MGRLAMRPQSVPRTDTFQPVPMLSHPLERPAYECRGSAIRFQRVPAEDRRCGLLASKPTLSTRIVAQFGRLQAKMQAQCFIDVEHDRVWDDAQPVTNTLHGDRADLFGLRLGVAVEPGL